MANVNFKYSTQAVFEAAQANDQLTEGDLWFTDEGKLYRCIDEDEAVVYSEPYEIVSSFPSVANARVNCLYIHSTTHEIKVKATSSAESLTTIVQALGTVYQYKGTKTADEFAAIQSPAAGDVYNVSESCTVNNVTYPAGTNFAYTGSAWDALAGIDDLSGYLNGSSVLGDLYNVSETGASSGKVLTYNGSGWAPADPPTHALGDLTNVSLGTGGSAPASGQVLAYNGSNWTNTTIDTSITWTEVTGE